MTAVGREDEVGAAAGMRTEPRLHSHDTDRLPDGHLRRRAESHANSGWEACGFHRSRHLALVGKSWAKVGKSFGCAHEHEMQKGPVSGAFPVAGAGFEPATSGL
jgi:hypothetical protein